MSGISVEDDGLMTRWMMAMMVMMVMPLVLDGGLPETERLEE